MRFRNILILLIFFLMFKILIAEETNDILEYYQNNKLDLNLAEESELAELYFLTESELEKIINYRKQNEIASVKDLQKLGLDDFIIEELLNYIYFQKIISFKNYLLTTYKKKYEGYESFLGFSQKTFVNYENFNFAFVNQKDAKEKNLFDFSSFYVNYKKDEYQILLGKYSLRIGQGLIFSEKLKTYKSNSFLRTAIVKSNKLKPYSGFYEMWELQGFALKVNYLNWEIIPFYSYNFLDANLEDDKITSFYTSGLHISNTEKDKKDATLSTIYGLSGSYKIKNLNLGFLISKFSFDKEFLDLNYHNNYLALSNNLSYETKLISYYSEIAIADAKVAQTYTLKYGENDFQQILLYRNFEKYFPNYFSNSFLEGSRVDNEEGMFYGFDYKLNSNYKLICFVDLFGFPEQRYYEKFSTLGNEYYTQISYKRNSNKINLEYSFKEKENYQKILDEGKIYNSKKKNVLLSWENKYYKFYSWKILGEYEIEEISEEDYDLKSYSVYFQNKVKFFQTEILFRTTYYDTKTILYQYQNDLDNIFNIKQLLGEYLAYFIVIKQKLFKDKLEIQAKLEDIFKKKEELSFSLQIITNL